MKNLIKFDEKVSLGLANTLLFRTADDLLNVKCLGIHETVAALVKCGASELYAKSVVVHIMTKSYLR